MRLISRLDIPDLRVGHEFSFEETITEHMVETFAALSGDRSTLHMNDGFAVQRGFSGRVVHGVLLLGLLSRAVGMHLPGENALMQTMNARFLAPVYVKDDLLIKVCVEQVSAATSTILLAASIEIRKTGIIALRCKIQVGLTSQKSDNG